MQFATLTGLQIRDYDGEDLSTLRWCYGPALYFDSNGDIDEVINLYTYC